jgi:Carboxypeptidase regulatory-like domain
VSTGAQRAGRVVDARGAPVPDAFVSVVESSVPVPEIALRTDELGRFSLRLPEGRFTLRADRGGANGQARVEGPPEDREIVIVVES